MNINGINKFIGKIIHVQKKNVSKSASKELFCEQYWKNCEAENMLRPTSSDKVSQHEILNGINHFFITGCNPKNMDSIFMNTKMTPREIIQVTDFEFKRVKPTTEKLNVFRCIGKKPDFFSEYNLYQKRLNIKKGEIIDMKEYAYATSDINYAKNYLLNNEGILYEIEVPVNSRVSRIGQGLNDEIVFPRSSKFQCEEIKKIQDGENNYTHINLKYIQP